MEALGCKKLKPVAKPRKGGERFSKGMMRSADKFRQCGRYDLRPQRRGRVAAEALQARRIANGERRGIQTATSEKQEGCKEPRSVHPPLTKRGKTVCS